jgi:hypothetical protein
MPWQICREARISARSAGVYREKLRQSARNSPPIHDRRAAPEMAIKAVTATSTGTPNAQRPLGRSTPMLYTIAVVLLVLWLLGLVSGYTLGAFVHVLLVIAVVLFLAGLVSGRRVV